VDLEVWASSFTALYFLTTPCNPSLGQLQVFE